MLTPKTGSRSGYDNVQTACCMPAPAFQIDSSCCLQKHCTKQMSTQANDGCLEAPDTTSGWLPMLSQAHLTPGVLHIDSATASAEVSVALTSQPTSQVSVRVTVPNAWDGSPLADLVPAQLTFDPDTWNTSQTVALLPKPVCVGDYYITFSFR